VLKVLNPQFSTQLLHFLFRPLELHFRVVGQLVGHISDESVNRVFVVVRVDGTSGCGILHKRSESLVCIEPLCQHLPGAQGTAFDEDNQDIDFSEEVVTQGGADMGVGVPVLGDFETMDAKRISGDSVFEALAVRGPIFDWCEVEDIRILVGTFEDGLQWAGRWRR
jgi:hypothetical protein